MPVIEDRPQIDLVGFRKLHQCSKAQLARSLMVEPQTVACWEADKRRHPPYLALALAYLNDHPNLLRPPARKARARRAPKKLITLPPELRWRPETL